MNHSFNVYINAKKVSAAVQKFLYYLHISCSCLPEVTETEPEVGLLIQWNHRWETILPVEPLEK